MTGERGPAQATSGERAPLVLGIDVEPDETELPLPGPRSWPGFEATLDFTRGLRQRLEASTGAAVHFSWFLRMDPQIERAYGSAAWVAERYEAELAGLLDAGDELGLHPHAWRWNERSGRWSADHGDAQWVEHCVRSSFAAFAAAFGAPCRAHRFGDRYLSDRLVGVLRSVGTRVDLTLEPGTRRMEVMRPGTLGSGTIPDQSEIPRGAYRPEPADFRRRATTPPAPGELWMMPLASADPDPALPSWRRVARRVRHPRRSRHRPLLLWAPWDPAILWTIAAEQLRSRALPSLAFMIRSDLLMRRTLAAPLAANLAALEQHHLARSVLLTTPTSAIDVVAAAEGPVSR